MRFTIPDDLPASSNVSSHGSPTAVSSSVVAITQSGVVQLPSTFGGAFVSGLNRQSAVTIAICLLAS